MSAPAAHRRYKIVPWRAAKRDKVTFAPDWNSAVDKANKIHGGADILDPSKGDMLVYRAEPRKNHVKKGR